MSLPIDIIIALMPDRATLVEVATGASHTRPHAGQEAGITVTALLKEQSRRRGSRVLVLGHDFFTQTVRLPELQCSGLSADELQTMLAFEVEPFSGIPAARGELAWAPAAESEAGMRHWQVLQINAAEAGALQSAVRGGGGRVAGFAALSSALQALPDNELTVALQQLWQQGDLPIIKPRPRKLISGNRELLAGVAFTLAAIACLGHFLWLRVEVRQLRQKVYEVEQEAAINQQLSSANNSLRRTIETEQAKRRKHREAAAKLEHYRQAWLVLMRGLCETSAETVVIRGVNSRELFQADINGICTSEHEPGDYLVRLASAVGNGGWRLNATEVAAPAAPGPGEPRRFSLRATFNLPASTPNEFKNITDKSFASLTGEN